jgi:hypothetical protein
MRFKLRSRFGKTILPRTQKTSCCLPTKFQSWLNAKSVLNCRGWGYRPDNILIFDKCSRGDSWIFAPKFWHYWDLKVCGSTDLGYCRGNFFCHPDNLVEIHCLRK